MSPYAVLYAIVAYQTASRLLEWYIERGRAKWEHRLRTFTDEHDGQIIQADPTKTLLFVVVPSSGAGRAMDAYDECIAELRKRNFTIDVHVTKSADDIKSLMARRGERTGVDLLSHYYGIVLLGGDSSVTELIQAPMVESGGKWNYPPILHLPGGSTNLLSKELHNGKSLGEILSQFSIDKVKRASAIKVSSPGSEPIYATHVAIHGLGRHMITQIEQKRSGLYATLGALALPFLILPSFFSPPNRDESPYFAFMVASTKNFAGGGDTGFDLDLFDEKLLLMHVTKYKGGFSYIKEVLAGMMSGEMAKQYAAGTLPEGLEVQMDKKFTLEGHDFHFVLDGTTTVEMKGRSVVIESVTGAIPYFVLNEG